MSGVGASWPTMWFPAIELLVSTCRDESEVGRSGRERNAAACPLPCWGSVVGNFNVLALLQLSPFVPVPCVRVKA